MPLGCFGLGPEGFVMEVPSLLEDSAFAVCPARGFGLLDYIGLGCFCFLLLLHIASLNVREMPFYIVRR